MDQIQVVQHKVRWRALQYSDDYLLSIKRKYFLGYMKAYPLLNEDSALGR